MENTTNESQAPELITTAGNRQTTQLFTKVLVALVIGLIILTAFLFLSPKTIVPVYIVTRIDDGGFVNDGEQGSLEEQLAAQSQIQKFEDYDELKEFMEEQMSIPSYGYYGGLGFGGNVIMESRAMMMDAQESDSAMPGALAAPKQAGSDDYFETNVQVQGVDEGDIIKTDGKYIYMVSKQDLFIVDAYPAEDANVLAKISFESTPQGIYLDDDRLVVYGRNDTIYRTDQYRNFRRRSSYTFLKVFDVSDPKNPKQLRDLDFEGNYNNSRKIGDYVYFVTQTYSNIWDDEAPVPRILENGDEIAIDPDHHYPDVYYFRIPYNSYTYTMITSVNIADSQVALESEVYMLTDNQNMYVSENNIYITYTKRLNEYQLIMEVMRDLVYPRLSLKDQDRIAKIEAADNFILSPDEKMQKITYIIERFSDSLSSDEQDDLEDQTERMLKQKYEDISKELEKTVVHKIAIDQGKLDYQTYGDVPGYVLNQFSMDEDQGYFRIATTKNREWSRFMEETQESYSNLYILDDELEVVGQIENIAPGERIFSVRFMQERAYMVTFRQTDPLFVIDVSDPRSPSILGELKIPGFSTYLHPYDENLLIGLGRQTKENEWGGVTNGGIKLSLFDVSDVADPIEVDNYVIGDRSSNSIALNDYHAFLFSKEKNLLVIPVEMYRWYNIEPLIDESVAKYVPVPKKDFRGAMVFTVNEDGFELRGQVDHAEGNLKDDDDEYWYGYRYYDSTVKRSLYIDDNLYTASNKYIKINKLDDLEFVKKVRLKKEKSGDDDDFRIIN